MTNPVDRDLAILLIEDNPGDAELLRQALKPAAGITLAWASSLEAGLELARSKRFDAALLDLSLPDSSGFQTLSRATEALPATPIIILTGLADEDMAMAAISRGAQDYLVKGQADGRAIVRAIRYATERQKKEEELRRLNRTLKALGNSSQAMVRATDESQYLEEVCRIIVEDCGHAMVWIGFAEEDEGKIVRPVAHAGFDEGYIDALRITWADTERGRGPTGTAIRTGKPTACRNMLTDPRFEPWRGEAIKRGYASSIVLPLMGDDKAFGALNVYSREPDPFSEDEVRLLAELADDLAYGIAALRLRIAVTQSEEALRQQAELLEERVDERTAQLRTLTLELTQAEQRERKRLAGVLHDHLQQLLVGAKMGLRVAQKQAGGKERRESLERVAELLNESIKASKSLTVELSPPILHEAGLVAAMHWLGRWMAETHGLTVEVEANTEIESDAEGVCILLFQSVRELLFNVVKHARVKEARIAISRTADGQVQAVVSDQGAGFDPAQASADDSTAGFGLFSVRERLKLLGGRFDIASAPGLGTRVKLLAPLPRPAAPKKAEPARREAAPQADGAEAVARQGLGRKIRVMVADDHRILREGLAQLLRAEPDIEVVGEASDGENAVEMAKRLRPDVLIMDVSMPRLNGIEATRRITSEAPGVRVIGLSMYEEADRATAMFEAGAVEYLHKAGPSEDLITAIHAHCEEEA